MFDPLRYIEQWKASSTGVRGCSICDHVSDCGKRCAHPNVLKPLDDARKQGGPCGVEAIYLSFPGLNK